MKRLCYTAVALMAVVMLCGAKTAPLTLPVGGLKSDDMLNVSGAIALREPDGPRVRCKHGFRTLNDSAAEWQKNYGAQFELKLPDAQEVGLTATILRFQRTATAGTSRRKVYVICAPQRTKARFLTVIEPYESRDGNLLRRESAAI